jgi:hypothetical protein
MSSAYTYYAIGYDYQRPTEWFAGSHEEAFSAFIDESSNNRSMRVRVVAETYLVDDDSKIQHVCERGCSYHLLDKTVWIHNYWGPPKWMRRLASRLS